MPSSTAPKKKVAAPKKSATPKKKVEAPKKSATPKKTGTPKKVAVVEKVGTPKKVVTAKKTSIPKKLHSQKVVAHNKDVPKKVVSPMGKAAPKKFAHKKANNKKGTPRMQTGGGTAMKEIAPESYIIDVNGYKGDIMSYTGPINTEFVAAYNEVFGKTCLNDNNELIDNTGNVIYDQITLEPLIVNNIISFSGFLYNQSETLKWLKVSNNTILPDRRVLNEYDKNFLYNITQHQTSIQNQSSNPLNLTPIENVSGVYIIEPVEFVFEGPQGQRKAYYKCTDGNYYTMDGILRG